MSPDLTFSIGLDVLTALLLAATIGYAVSLNRKLNHLRDNKGEMEAVIARLIEANPTQAQGYRDGKTGLMGFFVGQVMKETNGAADPEVTQDLVREALMGGGEEE